MPKLNIKESRPKKKTDILRYRKNKIITRNYYDLLEEKIERNKLILNDGNESSDSDQVEEMSWRKTDNSLFEMDPELLKKKIEEEDEIMENDELVFKKNTLKEKKKDFNLTSKKNLNDEDAENLNTTKKKFFLNEEEQNLDDDENNFDDDESNVDDEENDFDDAEDNLNVKKNNTKNREINDKTKQIKFDNDENDFSEEDSLNDERNYLDDEESDLEDEEYGYVEENKLKNNNQNSIDCKMFQENKNCFDLDKIKNNLKNNGVFEFETSDANYKIVSLKKANSMINKPKCNKRRELLNKSTKRVRNKNTDYMAHISKWNKV